MAATRKYILTPADLSFCLTLAGERVSCKYDTDPEGDMTAFASHYAGVIGELACTFRYGGLVNQTISPNGDKHGPDLVLPNGWEVEVKTTTWVRQKPYLKLTQKEMDAAVAGGYKVALIQLLWPDTCYVCQLVDTDFIRANCVMMDFGRGDRITVTKEQIENAEVFYAS